MAKRKIDGVLLLDKPVGITSNLALQKARWLYHAEKAGHTGTLDPFASGLLPLCFGEATKFSQFLLEADKVYLSTLRLGIRTSTGDPEGEVLESRPVNVSRRAVEDVLPRFLGRQMQLPPMHSALKKDGRPLYEYARKGVEVERVPRPVDIHAIELVDLQAEVLVLRVRCGKGVYVRTLAEDIGQALGCGAHLEALRREAVGDFRVADAHALDALAALTPEDRDALLAPPEFLLDRLPVLDLDLESAWQLCHGQPVWRAGVSVGEVFRVHDPRGIFLGVAEVDEEGRVAPRRLLATS